MFELEITSDNSDNKSYTSERMNLLKKIIDSLEDIVDQMEIKANDKGLVIQVMDHMHAALADICLYKDIFSSYRCDRDVILGIPLKQLSTIFKSIVVNESSIVKLSCEDTPQVLKLEHIMANSKYESNLTLYQMGSENYSIPQIDYQCSVKMESDQFRNMAKIVGSFGEHLIFKCEKDEFTLKQDSDVAKNMMNIKSNGESVNIDCTDVIELEMAMKYVNFVNKISTLSNELCINLSNDSPVCFSVKLYDSLGYIKFYVAPKEKD